MVSAERTVRPCWRKNRQAVDLPDPIPPVTPTTNPLPAILLPVLLRVRDRPEFTNDSHLDLPRVFHCMLDLGRNLIRKLVGHFIVNAVLLDDHSDLAPRLNCIGLGNPFKRLSDGLQFLKTLHIPFNGFPSGARTRAADCIRCLDQSRNWSL